MSVAVKQIEKNELYPLPADFFELTDDGQRLARINACRQFLVPGLTPDEVGEAFIASLMFYDWWYLWPHEEDDFDSQFYDQIPLPTPDFHKELARQAILQWLGLAVCPRGSGKTTEIKKEIMLQMTAVPKFFTIYCTSSNANMVAVGEDCKLQFQNNKRLHDDWAPEYGGRLMGSRGEMSRSATRFRLPHGSLFRGLSAKSKIRSIRPHVFYLDDPEYDESASTSMSEIRAYMEKLIFKVVIPAVVKAGSRMVWRATFITKRHFAYSAMSNKLVDGKLISTDARFDLWHRIKFVSEYQDAHGVRRSVWPEMWPLTVADKKAVQLRFPHLKGIRSLDEIRFAIGIPNYNSEYLAKPGEDTSAFFGSLTDEKHGYTFKHADEWLTSEPHRSGTLICWHENDGKNNFKYREMPLYEFVKFARLFMCGDTSTTSTTTSDYKATDVLAVTPNNDLFVLDLWADRCKEPTLILNTMKMADRWRAPSIHPEAIREGASYFEGLSAIVSTRAREMTGTQHLPRVVKLPRGQADKANLISGSLFRFEHGKIKLPLDKRLRWPWSMLFDQITDFNPDVEKGGLENDDVLDITTAHPMIVMRGRLLEYQPGEADKRTVLERMKAGETHDENGNPLCNMLDFRNAPATDILEILDKQNERNTAKRPSKV